jgi:hypothetical protein
MKLEFAIECLQKMQEENEKRKDIYKYGVDLANYENKYFEVAIDLLSAVFLNFSKNDFHNEKYIKDCIEWWLFEDVEKILILDNEKEVDVTKARDFVELYLELELAK